ncbi:MAG: N-acetylmuramoyl-L-alanine amidase family protein [Lachnotalea sp.]
MYKKQHRNQNKLHKVIVVAIVSTIFLLCLCFYGILKNEILLYTNKQATNAVEAQAAASNAKAEEKEEITKPDWITQDFLEINEYSRPGKKLVAVNAIVIHYTGNPGTTAVQHRHYYSELATTHEASVSSNYVVGIEGEVIQCIPTDEVAYASNDRNSDTLSIEVCHKDKSGKFTDASYESTVKLTAYLCEKFNLGEDGIIRHYDVTGKICPKYFVDHEHAWLQFKKDVIQSMETESWKFN